MSTAHAWSCMSFRTQCRGGPVQLGRWGLLFWEVLKYLGRKKQGRVRFAGFTTDIPGGTSVGPAVYKWSWQQIRPMQNGGHDRSYMQS